MGVSPFHRNSSCNCGQNGPAGPPSLKHTIEYGYGRSNGGSINSAHVWGNPDPRNFRILSLDQVTKDWCLARIEYPDAKNFEGQKVMLFRASADSIARVDRLDPHFCDNPTCTSPFARFEPTDAGWRAGVALAHIMQRTEDVMGEGNG